jgi:hypothetical protein
MRRCPYMGSTHGRYDVALMPFFYSALFSFMPCAAFQCCHIADDDDKYNPYTLHDPISTVLYSLTYGSPQRRINGIKNKK